MNILNLIIQIILLYINFVYKKILLFLSLYIPSALIKWKLTNKKVYHIKYNKKNINILNVNAYYKESEILKKYNITYHIIWFCINISQNSDQILDYARKLMNTDIDYLRFEYKQYKLFTESDVEYLEIKNNSNIILFNK